MQYDLQSCSLSYTVNIEMNRNSTISKQCPIHMFPALRTLLQQDAFSSLATTGQTVNYSLLKGMLFFNLYQNALTV